MGFLQIGCGSSPLQHVLLSKNVSHEGAIIMALLS